MLKCEVKNNQLIITMDLETPRPSSSGKTLTVASTGGFTGTEAKVGGKTVKLNVTASIAKG